jgi:alkanesulfonate monooxygenase SsuD/methylene tetrahydromethanopterin reductase-like flavin-dependent oxidoreductase (luciferase family)
MTLPSVGFVLPSQRLPQEASRELAREFRATAATAAEVGADTLWVWDHMLRAPVYADSWHDPLVSLAAVADFGLRLGTGILVAPVRPPVQTALAVATLQSLSGRAMRLGVGTGWNPTEFVAAGVEVSQRGALTDDFLATVTAVFNGERDFTGRFHRFEGLDAGYLGPCPEIWIAGGSRAAGAGSLGEEERRKHQMIAPAVARRIRSHGRWIVRPSAELSDFDRDMAELATAEDGTAHAVEASIICVAYLVETEDRELARSVQFPVFNSLVSEKRPPEYLEGRYLVGGISEVRHRISGWVDSGMTHIGLYLLGDTAEQIRLAKKHLGDLLDFRAP